MHRLSSPSARTHRLILKRFRLLYLFWTALFGSLTIAVVSWHWHQPRDGYLGVPYTQAVPVLLIASVLSNGISFYFQYRYTRRLLQHPSITHEFNGMAYAVRFYLYNLGTAVVLSLIGFFPLLSLLFFYWIYPVTVWFVPYHGFIGLLLGSNMKRGLSVQKMPSRTK